MWDIWYAASIYSNNKLDRKYLCVFFAVLTLKRQKGVLHAYVGTTFICPKNYHTYTIHTKFLYCGCRHCRRPWRTANWLTLHFMCGIETHYVLAGGSWTMNAFVLFRSKREPTFIKPSIPCLKFLVLLPRTPLENQHWNKCVSSKQWSISKLSICV